MRVTSNSEMLKIGECNDLYPLQHIFYEGKNSMNICLAW
jgi:hypothetical protein